MQNDKEFESKIIKFRSDISESEVYDDDDDYDEFEDWEVDYDLYSSQNSFRKNPKTILPEYNCNQDLVF